MTTTLPRACYRAINILSPDGVLRLPARRFAYAARVAAFPAINAFSKRQDATAAHLKVVVFVT